MEQTFLLKKKKAKQKEKEKKIEEKAQPCDPWCKRNKETCVFVLNFHIALEWRSLEKVCSGLLSQSEAGRAALPGPEGPRWGKAGQVSAFSLVLLGHCCGWRQTVESTQLRSYTFWWSRYFDIQSYILTPFAICLLGYSPEGFVDVWFFFSAWTKHYWKNELQFTMKAAVPLIYDTLSCDGKDEEESIMVKWLFEWRTSETHLISLK